MSYSNGALGASGSHWEWHMLREKRTMAFRGWFYSDEKTAQRISRCAWSGEENWCGDLSLVSAWPNPGSTWSWRSISKKVRDPLNPFRSTSRHVAWIWASSNIAAYIDDIFILSSGKQAWVYHPDGTRVA